MPPSGFSYGLKGRKEESELEDIDTLNGCM